MGQDRTAGLGWARLATWLPGAMSLVVPAVPAAAQTRPVPEQPASAAAAAGGVAVYLLNETDAPVTARAPDVVEVTAADGDRLRLSPDRSGTLTVPAGGFARLTYRTVPALATLDAAPSPPASAAIPRETEVAGSAGRSAAFLDRFAPAEPIYAVGGLADAGAKLQFSLAYRPFAGDGLPGHLRLAYTQTFFWALDRSSGPVRDTNHSPEAFLDFDLDPATAVAFGYRHDSNGEGDATSVNSHRITARLSRRLALGRGWEATLTPSAWIFVGSQGVADDLADYWGYTALQASVGRPDGIKLALDGRGNPVSGRGSLEGFVSYPLTRLGGLALYAFGQGFVGYGEAITQYDIRDSHLRIGFSVTR